MAVGGCPAWKDGAMVERDPEKVSLTVEEKYYNTLDIEGFFPGISISIIKTLA